MNRKLFFPMLIINMCYHAIATAGVGSAVSSMGTLASSYVYTSHHGAGVSGMGTLATSYIYASHMGANVSGMGTLSTSGFGGSAMSGMGGLTSIAVIRCDFKVSKTNPAAGENVTFTPMWVGYPRVNRWIWDFGDGTVLENSSPSSPTHSYQQPGTYTVSLRVRNIILQTWQETKAACIHVGGQQAGGIELLVKETGQQGVVKYVGYYYKYRTIGNNMLETLKLFPVQPNGNCNINEFPASQTFNTLLPPKTLVEDFDDILYLFDVNQKRIGHIEYAYNHKVEGQFTRNAILLLHNDADMCITGGETYFPYSKDSPEYHWLWKYYKPGEYPVSMLVPPANSFPSNTTGKSPVLLIHGWEGSFSYKGKESATGPQNLAGYWYTTASRLNAKATFHAWQFYYPYNTDFFHLAKCLRKGINEVYSRYNQPVGLVTHSMGGLVTARYLTMYQSDKYKIKKVLFSVPPIHGSLGANYYYKNFGLERIISLFSQYDAYAPAVRDMKLGSQALWDVHHAAWPDMNSNGSLKDDYFVIEGTICKSYSTHCAHVEAFDHHDGIVSMSSASLLDHGIGLASFYGNHEDGVHAQSYMNKPGLIPDIIADYMSNPYDNFIELLAAREDIRAVIKHDRTVRKPLNATISQINTSSYPTGEEDVTYQKGNLILQLDFKKIPREFICFRPYQGDQLILDKSTGPWNNPIGYFTRNDESASENIYSYWALSHGCSFSFSTPITKLSIYDKNGFLTWKNHNYNLESRPCETQMLTLVENASKSADSVNNQTDVKAAPVLSYSQPPTADSINSFFVDDQAVFASFRISCPEAMDAMVNCQMRLQMPDGSILDPMSPDITYSLDSSIGMFSMGVPNPMFGTWLCWLQKDSLSDTPLEYKALTYLQSEITAFLPDSSETTDQSQVVLQAGLMADTLALFDSLQVQATVSKPDGLQDVMEMEVDIIASDSTMVFSVPFTFDTTGWYEIKVNYTGKYGNYWFERVTYQELNCQSLSPFFSLPDVVLWQNQPIKDLDLPSFLNHIQEEDTVVFQVFTLPSSLDTNGFIAAYNDTTQHLTLVTSLSDTGRIAMVVTAWLPDSLALTDTLMVIVEMVDLLINNATPGSDTVNPGEFLPFELSVRNSGNRAVGSFSIQLALTADTSLQALPLQLIFTEVAFLDTNALVQLQDSLLIPSSLSSGTYYLRFMLDSDQFYDELHEENNLQWVPVVVRPDVSLGEVGPLCLDAEPLIIPHEPPGGIFNGPGMLDSLFYPGLAGPGLHTLYYTVLDSNGFQREVSTLVEVMPLPFVNLGNDTVLVNGDTLILDAGNTGSIYLWQDSTTGRFLAIDTAGIYWVQVFSEYGCRASDTIVITEGGGLASLNGTVHYKNSLLTPLPFAHVWLLQGADTVCNTIAGNTGYFECNNLLPADYVLSAGIEAPTGSINASDALVIMRHFVLLSELTGLNKDAADVDGSNNINAADALLVMRRFVGLINTFSTGDWIFEQYPLTLVPGLNISQDVSGLAYGDVDASYIPLLRKEPGITLKQQGEIQADHQGICTMPFSLEAAEPLGAISLEIKYNPKNFQIAHLSVQDELLNDRSGAALWNILEGNIRFAWYSLVPQYFNKERPLFTLHGKVNHLASSMFEAGDASSLADAFAGSINEAVLYVPGIIPLSSSFQLNCCFPNPVQHQADVMIHLPCNGHLVITLHNCLGQEVTRLCDAPQTAGSNNIELDVKKLRPGIYWLRASFTHPGGHEIRTAKLMVVD